MGILHGRVLHALAPAVLPVQRTFSCMWAFSTVQCCMHVQTRYASPPHPPSSSAWSHDKKPNATANNPGLLNTSMAETDPCAEGQTEICCHDMTHISGPQSQSRGPQSLDIRGTPGMGVQACQGDEGVGSNSSSHALTPGPHASNNSAQRPYPSPCSSKILG